MALLAAGMVLLFTWQWSMHAAQERSADYVQTIRTLIPEPQGSVPLSRQDNAMPMLSLDGTDFVGILELPNLDLALPVGGNWGDANRHPCRLDGSVYDGTLQIGGTSQKGQFDAYRDLSVGDTLYFTDMEGNRYAYRISQMRYESHADQTALQQNDAALTLFIKNIYGFDYLIVFCDVMN